MQASPFLPQPRTEIDRLVTIANAIAEGLPWYSRLYYEEKLKENPLDREELQKVLSLENNFKVPGVKKDELKYDLMLSEIHYQGKKISFRSRIQHKLLVMLFELELGEGIKTERLERELYDTDVNDPKGALKALIRRVNEKTKKELGFQPFQYGNIKIIRKK